MELLRQGRQKLLEHREKEGSAYHAQKQQEQDRYYSYVFFLNSRNKKPYRTSLYDSNGRRRTVLELILLLAITVLKKEEGLWDVTDIPTGKENDPIYAPRSWKIQNMIDSIYTARDESIDSPLQLEECLKESGAAYSRTRAALKSTTRAKEKMETLNAAVQKFRKTEGIAEQILNMRDGPDKAAIAAEYQDILDVYKTAKAVLSQYHVTSEEEIVDFENRFIKIQEDIVQLEECLEQAKEDHRRLKKLSYNIQLAQNAQYCYGPDYTPTNIRRQEERESAEAGNSRASKKDASVKQRSGPERQSVEKDPEQAQKQRTQQ